MVFIFIKLNQIIANFNVFVNTLPLLWYNWMYEFRNWHYGVAQCWEVDAF